MQVTKGRVSIYCTETAVIVPDIQDVLVDSTSLYNLLGAAFSQIRVRVKPPPLFAARLIFDPDVKEIADVVFDTIASIENDGDTGLSVRLADYLFEGCTPAWKRFIAEGRLVLAAKFWEELSKLATDWENKNQPHKIHKGTLYHFLASTYMSQGDTESGFVSAFRAIDEDKRTYFQLYKDSEAYRQAPICKYVDLVDDRRNYMHPSVRRMRQILQTYIREYRRLTHSQFDFSTLEKDFLKNRALDEVKYYFVYNLETLVKDLTNPLPEMMARSDFSRLRNLDRIFNLCLIVDKVLEDRYGGDTIGKNVFRCFNRRRWISNIPNAGKLASCLSINMKDDPDAVVPPLLDGSVTCKRSLLRRDMCLLILAWHLRNYGGHNIRGQKVLVERYSEIISSLMGALFVSLET